MFKSIMAGSLLTLAAATGAAAQTLTCLTCSPEIMPLVA